MTRGIILVELAVATVAGLVFLVLYGWRSRWRETAMGRHMMVFAVVTAVEAGSLFALGLGLPVPLWMFAVGYGLLDAVLIQRLFLLLKAQRH